MERKTFQFGFLLILQEEEEEEGESKKLGRAFLLSFPLVALVAAWARGGVIALFNP